MHIVLNAYINYNENIRGKYKLTTLCDISDVNISATTIIALVLALHLF